MNESTRRGFLVMAGTTAASVGAAVVAPSAVAGPAVTPLRRDASGPLVAHVRDVRAGTLCLMVGEREVVVDDHDLVARLVRAAS
jgi:hypothetical protein